MFPISKQVNEIHFCVLKTNLIVNSLVKFNFDIDGLRQIRVKTYIKLPFFWEMKLLSHFKECVVTANINL